MDDINSILDRHRDDFFAFVVVSRGEGEREERISETGH
jgi:hypothetical protein